MEIDQESYLKSVLDRLMLEPLRDFDFSSRGNMASSIPNKPGVYIIVDKIEGVFRYVGETKSLKGRWNDMYDSRNHNFLRLIGKKVFSLKEAEMATSKRPFSPENDKRVKDHIILRYGFRYLALSLGRKEFEDYVQCHPSYRDTLYNSPSRRGGIG